MNKFFKTHNQKKMVILIILMIISITCLFAADDFGLDSKIQILLKFLSSPWIKGVACIALIIETIGLITAGRQEPGMFKKFIPWIAGTIIFMAAGTITSKFMDTVTETTFTTDLKLSK